MTEPTALSTRLDALEIRVAYQDQILEDLNETITSQWKQIDLLTRRLAKLTDEFAEAQAQTDRPPTIEPPPPHY